MVRLVFRPYTQLRRSICTSESLRTSTRVSSGFILAKHSSPSFGSRHVCSWYLPTARALGHSGQSRIGERHRAGRARGEPRPPAERRPKTRGTPTESPSRADEANNRFARRRRMASPGPAPPCVQAETRERAEPPTGPAVLTGERVSPRAPPQAVPLWYGTATAASLSQGSAPEDAVATAEPPRDAPLSLSLRLWV